MRKARAGSAGTVGDDEVGSEDIITIQRPGTPEDLPAADLLWARWALLAAAAATGTDEAKGHHRTGIWIDADGLHLDDCGCTWWVMARRGEGRFVLYGEDEASAVKFHRPPIDMLAGAPEWLPLDDLRDRTAGFELGCVYWNVDGVWARALYPDDLRDDGLDCGMSRFVDRHEVLDELSLHLAVPENRSAAEGFLSDAEAYRLDAGALLSRMNVLTPADAPLDREAVARALAATGIVA